MKHLSDEDIKQIILIATSAAVKACRAEQEKSERAFIKRFDRGRNAKEMLKAYRRMKKTLEEDIDISPDEMREIRYNFLADLMGANTNLMTKTEIAIMDYEYKRKKNWFIIKNIERAIKLYEAETENANEEAKRRYRVMCAAYIDDSGMDIKEIAEMERISEKTVYKDINNACDIMADYML